MSLHDAARIANALTEIATALDATALRDDDEWRWIAEQTRRVRRRIEEKAQTAPSSTENLSYRRVASR